MCQEHWTVEIVVSAGVLVSDTLLPSSGVFRNSHREMKFLCWNMKRLPKVIYPCILIETNYSYHTAFLPDSFWNWNVLFIFICLEQLISGESNLIKFPMKTSLYTSRTHTFSSEACFAERIQMNTQNLSEIMIFLKRTY